MVAADILEKMKHAGLTVTVIDGSKLLVEPKDKITNTIREYIKESKAELLSILSGEELQLIQNNCKERKKIKVTTPVPCQNCSNVEFLVIAGKQVGGCLYQALGEFPDGWKRLPANLTKCFWL